MPRREPLLPDFVSRATPAHTITLAQVVAFRDCDPMGVLWHGNYLAYCEAARDALGLQIGIGIGWFREQELFAPIIRSHLVHYRPLRPGERFSLTAELYATTQPRLYHRYRLDVEAVCAAIVETEQVLTDRDFGLILKQPELISVLLK